MADGEGFGCVDESLFCQEGFVISRVAQQYCGRLEKRENCLSGVFLKHQQQKNGKKH